MLRNDFDPHMTTPGIIDVLRQYEHYVVEQCGAEPVSLEHCALWLAADLAHAYPGILARAPSYMKDDPVLTS